MNAKFNRKLWMQLHGYVSVFFLPLACLYAISGVLTIWVDPDTVHKSTLELTALTPMAPVAPDSVRALITAELQQRQLPLPSGELKQKNTQFEWGERNGLQVQYRHSEQNPQNASLRIIRPTFFGHLMAFHKGKGGTLLNLLASGFALLLLSSYLSGLLLALKTTWMQKAAWIALILGVVVSVSAVFWGF